MLPLSAVDRAPMRWLWLRKGFKSRFSISLDFHQFLHGFLQIFGHLVSYEGTEVIGSIGTELVPILGTLALRLVQALRGVCLSFLKRFGHGRSLGLD